MVSLWRSFYEAPFVSLFCLHMSLFTYVIVYLCHCLHLSLFTCGIVYLCHCLLLSLFTYVIVSHCSFNPFTYIVCSVNPCLWNEKCSSCIHGLLLIEYTYRPTVILIWPLFAIEIIIPSIITLKHCTFNIHNIYLSIHLSIYLSSIYLICFLSIFYLSSYLSIYFFFFFFYFFNQPYQSTAGGDLSMLFPITCRFLSTMYLTTDFWQSINNVMFVCVVSGAITP